MDEIIKIEDRNGKKAVNARELHAFLGNKRQFADWIKQRIEQYGFVEDQDYSSFDNIVKRETGATVRKEYALSLDMAKELSMVENNEKGRLARKYFIECEKIAKDGMLIVPNFSNPAEAARAWADQYEKNLLLSAENKKLEDTNIEMKPKADYFDGLVDRNLLTNFRDTAKQIGITQKDFIGKLISRKYVYRDKKGRIKPYSQFDKLFKIKDYQKGYHTGHQTLITPEGKETFRLLFGVKQEQDLWNDGVIKFR